MTTALDVIGAVLLVLGTFLTVAAAIGMLRFPDLLSRLHATSKPQSLGIVLMMAGLALSMRSSIVAWTAVLIVLLQIVTAPIGAHMAGRAGYRTGQVDSRTLVTDEYRHDLAAAQRAQQRAQQQAQQQERSQNPAAKQAEKLASKKRGKKGGQSSSGA